MPGARHTSVVARRLGRPRLAAGLLALAIAAPAAPVSAAEPTFAIAAGAEGCSGVSGNLLVVLPPSGGAVLLAEERLPESRRFGVIGMTRLSFIEEPLAGVQLPVDGSVAGPDRADRGLWGYRIRPGALRYRAPKLVCIASPRSRFATAGDLVTYARWLIDDVYAELPPVVRGEAIPFTLADRNLRIDLRWPDTGPVAVTLQEGAPQAITVPQLDDLLVLTAYVLDAAEPQVALRVATKAPPYFSSSPEVEHGVVELAPSSAPITALEGLRVGVLAVE